MSIAINRSFLSHGRTLNPHKIPPQPRHYSTIPPIHRHSRFRRISDMSSGDSFRQPLTPQPPEIFPFELKEDSDFDQIVSPDGLVSICGFGSLLSERSARSTFPHLINFRMTILSGFRRVFAHVAPVFFERGVAKTETKEISSLSVEPCEGETLVVTTFEIQRSEIPAFIEREHEFRFLAVIPETFNGLFYTTPAVLCSRYSDEEYFKNRCKGSQEIFFQRYGRFGINKIWVDDILPCRVYLRHCVLAAKNLGDLAYDNFLDHTFLGDRKTTIREYLATAGSSIMEEEPPEMLKYRYGG
ncbi:Hypothetical predicted protein [Olea europaea subsp. europaea]|uniref:Uncharacterized protein n=1 Tax=Olea europaea subsp. europaea TaxID=158383 RepID=A0A8S0UTM7_OLEEU|nr:Hypothetical predicted protein [Olea europaea subsp. europaea]